jgi:Thrombospondin type 3 repeat/Beta-propeller repeat
VRRAWAIGLAALGLACMVALWGSRHAGPTPDLGGALGAGSADRPVAPDAGRSAFRNLPLSFVQNRGQSDPHVRFEARAAGIDVWFTAGGAALVLERGERVHTLGLRFVGANRDAAIVPGARREGRVTHLAGGPRTAGLPTYGTVTYRDLWPGIDMVFHGTRGKLKYEFRLAPGADPNDIRLAYGGADGLAVTRGGALAIDTPLGTVHDQRPRSWQHVGERRAPVRSQYALGDGGRFGFALGAHHPSRPLVIDPGIVYSSFIGGSSFEDAAGVAIDGQGNAYVAGGIGATYGAIAPRDAFVVKLDPSGSSMLYTTYLGGAGDEYASALSVDSQGHAYVGGTTDSTDFPTTPGAFDTTRSGEQDTFVTKLTADGSGLVYSTLFGGAGPVYLADLAIDQAGAVYMTGDAGGDLPTTPGSYDTVYSYDWDGWAAKLNPAGSAIEYGTYLGGPRNDGGTGIALAAGGNAIIVGHTYLADGFPTTAGAYDTTPNGERDGFVLQLNPTGSGLVYSTLLGGSSDDLPWDVAVDPDGNSYVTGRAYYDGTFPTTPGAYDTASQSGAFATKVNASGTALVYSTFLGGNYSDFGYGIAIDESRNAYVAGADTTAEDSGSSDAFLKKLDPAGSALLYETTLGAENRYEQAVSVAVDRQENAYIVGRASSDFPVTEGAQDTQYTGEGDEAFIAKIGTAGNRDADGDGVADSNDNCAGDANAGQLNSDGDELGDACDPDRDGDRYANAADNCPNDPNASQLDDDGDGTGNRCDSDWVDPSCAPSNGVLAAQRASIDSQRSALAVRGGQPLSFVPNHGQADSDVRFEARGAGFGIQLTDTHAMLALERGKHGQALELRFVGANRRPRVEADSPQPGRVSYFGGVSGRADLPTFGAVTYTDLWPGIDMVLRGDVGRLKYEFHLDPGADPGDIRLAYRGASRVSRAPDGALWIRTPIGTLKDERPVSWETAGGVRTEVSSRYVVSGPRGRYGFAVSGHDSSQPLVIDPGIVYSTVIGGSSVDEGNAVAVDAQGSAYVAGWTFSGDFPTTPGAYDTGQGNFSREAFVTKLAPDGSTPVYSTYIGGADSDEARDIAVDAAGAAYVTGMTASGDFPTTAGAHDSAYDGQEDGFALKLDPSGSALTYSTFLGGSGQDQGRAVALDSHGHPHITGETRSTDFPSTPGAFDETYTSQPSESPSHSSPGDAFVTKLEADGDLAYSTFLGGGNLDQGNGVALDPQDNAYIVGLTFSGGGFDGTKFPVTPGAWDETYGYGGDAFITKLNPSGSDLVYSTFLADGRDIHGGSADSGDAIAVSANGSAYVTGRTLSDIFPTTPGAFDTHHSPRFSFDAFVTLIDPSGSNLAYSTFLGGDEDDRATGIAVDSTGAAWVTGHTGSLNFPLTSDAADSSLGGAQDAFVTRFSESGSRLLYSTYYGGPESDEGRGIKLDRRGSAYVAGLAQTDEIGDALVFKVGELDCDGDGVRDGADNCPEVANPDQHDQDGDGIGDECDPSPGSTPGCSVDVSGSFGTALHARIRLAVDPAGRPAGRLTFRDKAANLNYRAIKVDTMLVHDRRATIRGEGRSGTDKSAFKVIVEDGPGRAGDTFRAELDTGYSSSGSLRSGSVRISC